jgi:hypothetical protein
MEELYAKYQAGKLIPIVCLICNRFIKLENINYLPTDELVQKQHLFQGTTTFKADEKLKIEYNLAESPHVTAEVHTTLSSCMFSPRSTFVQHDDHRRTSGYTICDTCHNCMVQSCMPIYCIAHNYVFGQAPECLLALSEVELAMITPVKTFGYCFSFTGGVFKST